MGARVLPFEEALLSMDRVRCRALLGEAGLAWGGDAGIEGLITPALTRIGDRWEAGELALTQVYMAGRICEDLLSDLGAREDLHRADGPRIGVAVLLDHHQLGKRIVSASLRAGGFQVLDYGHGQEVATLARRALEDRLPILMVSVLMFHSALHVKELRRELGEGPDRPRLVVGGAPFRLQPDLWREVGADAAGQTGVDAVGIAQRMLEGTCVR